jgi:hypothetical protein
VHVSVRTFDILLAEVDDDLEGVVADDEYIRVSAFGLLLIHARLAVACARVSQHAPLIAARRVPVEPVRASTLVNVL